MVEYLVIETDGRKTMPAEVYRFTLDGQVHSLPWHTYSSAKKDSGAWGEVLVWFSPSRDAWMHAPLKRARGHEDATVQFVIREGSSFDMAGNKLDGQRRNAA